MRKLILPFLLLSLLITSCNKEEAETAESLNGITTGIPLADGMVIQERDPNVPLILSMKRERLDVSRTVDLTFGDYLGRGYKAEYFPFESVLNIADPVLDIRKINNENPDWASSITLRMNDISYFSYYGFDRYTQNTTMVDKVQSGFQLNLGIFKIGKKSYMEETFTASAVNEKTSIMGQYDIVIQHAKYNLSTVSTRLQRYRQEYLHPDFRNDIHNLTPGEFFDNYGGFILTKFITGGRASALYHGNSRSNESAELLEDEMSKSMNASIGFKNKDSISGDLGVGAKYGNGASMSNKISNLKIHIKTLGGGYDATFSAPKDFSGVDISLTPWLVSMNDPTTHTVVDIFDGGLLPITELILEQNLKDNFLEYYTSGNNQNIEFVEPFIEIFDSGVTADPNGFRISIFLRNRYNERITMNTILYDGRPTSKEQLFQRLSEIYKLKIITNPLNSSRKRYSITKNNSATELLEYDMIKYTDTVNDMIYLLYNKDGNKSGLSIYNGNGGYLLDTYGIREFVESLPESNFNPYELVNYQLIAL